MPIWLPNNADLYYYDYSNTYIDMIKTINIQNFQSHKETNLELANGVNVIIGRSDTGKSAIIRALRWLIWNRPTGEEFRSTWGERTDVTIEIDEEIIGRIRDKQRNQYELGTPSIVFKALSTDVPEEISKLLNINEINLQQQLDSHFLLSSTPGEVAQHFNRVAHLEKIDSMLKSISGWIRQIEQDIRSSERRQEELEGELKQFDHLDKFEADVEVLERMDQDLQKKYRDKQQLTTLIKSIEQVGEQIEKASFILKDETLVNDVLELYARRNDLNTHRQRLNTLLYNLTTVQEKLVTGEKNVLKFEKIFRDKFPDICPLCGQTVKHKTK